MKKVLVFAGLVLIAGIVTPAQAEECSNADLRGLYSFVASGTLGGRRSQQPARRCITEPAALPG